MKSTDTMKEKSKIRLAVMCGGKSAEHEVSLQSAYNIVQALDRSKYELTVIGIDKQGAWHLNDPDDFLENKNNPENICLKPGRDTVAFIPGNKEHQLVGLSEKRELTTIDVVFPVLHGTCGEDGTIQGLLSQAEVPFVGAGVAGSAVAMDKELMKRLLLQAGIPTARYVSLHNHRQGEFNLQEIVNELGLPLFVKPANLGSSVGISKVHKQEELIPAVREAFRYDNKILIEEFIDGRELECSVLGNEKPQASVIGEIKVLHEFYSYEAKYLDDKGAELIIPAPLEIQTAEAIQKTAVNAFKVLECSGMARVDFFLRGNDEVFVNELNTIPGFTRISMYPKLWEASGLEYGALLDRLIGLAFERHEREQQLKTQR